MGQPQYVFEKFEKVLWGNHCASEVVEKFGKVLWGNHCTNEVLG